MVSSWSCWASMPVLEIERERIMAGLLGTSVQAGAGISRATAAGRPTSRRPPRSAATSSGIRTGGPRRSWPPSRPPGSRSSPPARPLCSWAAGSASSGSPPGVRNSVSTPRMQGRVGRHQLQAADQLRGGARHGGADAAVCRDVDRRALRHLDRAAITQHRQAAVVDQRAVVADGRAARRGCRPRCRRWPARSARRCPASPRPAGCRWW